MAIETEPHMKYFSIVSGFFVATLLISNTVSSKLISVGPLVLAGGIIIFPITYIFGDVLTEVYGYKRSRKIIWTGFAALGLMSIVYWAVGLLTPAPGWENQTAYQSILGIVPRIAVASLIGFWAGEFVNSYVLAKMKIWTKGRHLWMRTIGSTLAGEGIDTALFVLIGFAGVFPTNTLIAALISGYVVKVLYEVLATPATYKIIAFLKRAEGCDHFDYETDFNPFILR